MKRKPQIEIVTNFAPSDTHYWWRLVGANGKIICHSETFPSRSNAVRAAKRAIAVMTEQPEVRDA